MFPRLDGHLRVDSHLWTENLATATIGLANSLLLDDSHIYLNIYPCITLVDARIVLHSDGVAHFTSSQVADLLGVSADTVRRWCDEGRLASTRTSGGHRMVEGSDLVDHLREHAKAFASEPVAPQTARNRFTGIITRVEKDKITALIEVHSGPHRLVSLITREAADELDLKVGDLATASVKSTNVVIEIPRS